MITWKLFTIILILIIIFNQINKQRIIYYYRKKILYFNYNKQIKKLNLRECNKNIKSYYYLLYKLIKNFEYLNYSIDLNKLINNSTPTIKDINYLKEVLKDFISRIPNLNIIYLLSSEYNLFHYGFLLFPFIFGIIICLN